MLRTGLLTPGTAVVGRVCDADTTAHIQPDGHLRLATGDVFRNPMTPPVPLWASAARACCSGTSRGRTAPGSRSGTFAGLQRRLDLEDASLDD
jgi:hypothetical protein